MSAENTANGVFRYVEMLLEGIPSSFFELIHLRFIYHHSIKLPKQIVRNNLVEIIIPLPVSVNEYINNDYWRAEYNIVAAHMLEPYLKRNGIIHIQTTNLIDLAVYLRQLYNLKIVSHIHCIPWKYKYSSDPLRFNHIYNKINIEKKINNNDIKSFVVNDEYKISKESDAIICVTNCAKEYYKKYLNVSNDKLFCIYNGICDEMTAPQKLEETLSFHSDNRKPVRLLYVGGVTREKGFQYVLKALQIVKERGYDFELKVAGKIEREISALIASEYTNLNIDMLGLVSYTELCTLYQSSHIGLVPSLFEQCSYVAIEMSMFGLPVLFSDIDELHEVFSKETEMSIPVIFSLYTGISLDVSVFADKIIQLMKSPELRKKIGKKLRDRYINYFGLNQMIQKTINVYNNLY